MKGLTFGADVEFFIGVQGKVYPQVACGLFGGTKQEPIQFPDEEKGYMYQEDGCALELNVPVSNSAKEFGAKITHMLELGNALVKERAGEGACLSQCSGLTLTRERGDFHHRDIPEVKEALFPQAYVVGCDPDFDAYLFDQRPLMTIQELGSYRHAGGHIHVGYDTDACPRELFVRCMDSYLSSVFKTSYRNDNGFTKNRFHYYGYPGIYRPKSYGVEYRPLNGNWTIRYYDAVIKLLGQMEDDWINKRDKFYERGMSLPDLATQIHGITGNWVVPRGHTEESCGMPHKYRREV